MTIFLRPLSESDKGAALMVKAAAYCLVKH